ncbi:DinB family protein [bacterium]|nr:DinB family protein [bacterium]
MPSPRDLAQTLAIQYDYTAWVFNKAVEDISHADSLVQPSPAGNCMNWVAGHIAGSRMGTLEVVGVDSVWNADRRARYKRGSDPLSGDDGAVDFAEIVGIFNASQAPLLAALPGLTAERLDAPAPFSPGNDENETVGSLLAGLAFHESYHCGQLGILRRLLDRDGFIK